MGKRGKTVLSVSHSLCDKAGLAIHSALPRHPLPDTIFLAATHTHTHSLAPPRSLLQSTHTCTHPHRTLCLSPPDNPSPTPPNTTARYKDISEGMGRGRPPAAGAGEAGQRWRRDLSAAELTRREDSICRQRHLPFTDNYSSFSLPPSLSEPIAALVNMENSRTIDHPGIVIVVCSLLSIPANVSLKK